MGSLRSRHLLSSFVIFIIGILILGVWLDSAIHQRKMEEVSSELERTALDLLGYIEFENDTLLIKDDNRSEADDFLNEQRLYQDGKNRFAYIWDAAQETIVWDSLDNNDVDQESIKNNFALFDFKAILRQIPATGFAPAEAFKMHSLPSESGGESMEYLVAVQKFLLKVEGDKREFLFLVATSIADVEREVAELFGMFATILLIAAGLLFIAHLAFSVWVVAPIKTFEAEVLALKKGVNESIEGEYPIELAAIKDKINTLNAR